MSSQPVKGASKSEDNKTKPRGTSNSTSNSTSNQAHNSQVKGTVRSAVSQPEKRTHSEVTESSFGDEITMINKQLEQMNNDIHETKDSVKSLLSKQEMKAFIVSTVEAISAEQEKRLEATIERKVEEKFKEKTAELNQRLDMITYENVELKEQVDKLTETVTECEKMTKFAIQKSNTNEQYSRKNNVKVMGVVEKENETELTLTREVIEILESKAQVTIEESKIMALHRIPGKIGMNKPVLIKLINNSEKTKIMKKRKEMKRAGFRLVDDVTKSNTTLINTLSQHEKIESAWYFNGSVYAKTIEGRRHKFDISSDIDETIEPKQKDATNK